MKRLTVVVCGLMLCVLASAARADDPITTVRVLHPSGAGFVVGSEAEGNVLRQWLALDADNTLMFERDVTQTLPTSIQTYSNESADILDVIGGSSGVSPDRTCCWMECTGLSWNFDKILKSCATFGYNCQNCTVHCTSGWTNCPGGTTAVLDYSGGGGL